MPPRPQQRDEEVHQVAGRSAAGGSFWNAGRAFAVAAVASKPQSILRPQSRSRFVGSRTLKLLASVKCAQCAAAATSAVNNSDHGVVKVRVHATPPFMGIPRN